MAPDELQPEQTECVEVRRRGRLAATVGALAAAVSVAYLRRATDTVAVVDLVVAGAFALMAVGYFAAWLDARSPLMVFDAAGVRCRLGSTWRALTWAEVNRVDVVPPRGWFRDGRLRVVPGPDDALDGLSGPARAQAWLNRRLYGASIALPLGLSTQVRPTLSALSDAVGGWAGEGPPRSTASASATRPHWRDPRPALAAGIGALASRLRMPRRFARNASAAAQPEPLPESSAPAVAGLREPRVSGRSHAAVTAPGPDDTQPVPIVAGALALRAEESDVAAAELPEVAELRRPADSDSGGSDPVAPREPVPVANPVVGPLLVAARDRLGLTVVRLAERTRIRAHVIEAIDVDDFGPCGGDFYARGHLRTLARVLGIDSTPLLSTYDELYADAPVPAQRVFVADLPTTGLPSLRGTKGGPNWSLLVAAVMAAVLVWSVVQLAVGGPAPREPIPGLSDGSGGVRGSGVGEAETVPILITAAGGGARVIVRDGEGRIVFSGNLAYGASRSLRAIPPVRVDSSDGSLEVVVAGENQGALGETGRPAVDSFVG